MSENNMYYEVDSVTFAIRIWDGIHEEPFQYQPTYPNGDPFDSVEEASAWAEEAINSHNPEYGFFPPIGKGMPSDPKPTPEQITQAKLAQMGITVEELRALLNL